MENTFGFPSRGLIYVFVVGTCVIGLRVILPVRPLEYVGWRALALSFTGLLIPAVLLASFFILAIFSYRDIASILGCTSSCGNRICADGQTELYEIVCK